MTGRAFLLGDRIDTDILAPGALMKLPPEDLARHCLRAVRPDFADAVRPGDFVVAGEGFGIGSSREQAAGSLRLLGVRAVLAKSFARIFYRNAFNLGLPALAFDEDGAIAEGDILDLDLAKAQLHNVSTGRRFELTPPPAPLLAMAEAGGLAPLLKKRFQAKERGHDGD